MSHPDIILVPPPATQCACRNGRSFANSRPRKRRTGRLTTKNSYRGLCWNLLVGDWLIDHKDNTRAQTKDHCHIHRNRSEENPHAHWTSYWLKMESFLFAARTKDCGSAADKEGGKTIKMHPYRRSSGSPTRRLHIFWRVYATEPRPRKPTAPVVGSHMHSR